MLLETVSAENDIHFNPHYLRIKRVLDIIFTLLIFIPLCLVITIVAVAIRLDSKGPIFFRQKRVGHNGVEFEMYKFRSMYDKSDESLHRRVIEQYIADQVLNESSNTQYKQVNDPRVTRVGRFIRKTSIDELPQFFNVLRGEMTLVGPRPPLPYEVELYSPCDLPRLRGKPGLTGTWQVYGRSHVPFSTMVEMDIDYLRQQSLWLDIKLIFLTLPVMIFARGGV
jgi:lipopolysaccharide/colanic/teichoic acid biosynthesis glycosyltransferase